MTIIRNQLRFCVMVIACSIGAGLLLAQAVAAEQLELLRNVDGIKDNSFLVEEAYNQEKGVVQHILNAVYELDHRAGADDQSWALVFTQEWPIFSQAHQFSYTVPYHFRETAGQSENGFGDVLLNYRYQAYFNPESLTAFAPRASLVLPTGDQASVFGEDTVGAQFNLPFSTTLSDKWFTHLNAGLTFLPNAASAQGQNLLHYNLGASVIYAHTRDLHMLLEWVGYWSELKEPSQPSRHEFTSLISPGVRKAFNFANESQLVLGLAAPIGLTSSSPEFGLFFYVSFEQIFSRQ